MKTMLHAIILAMAASPAFAQEVPQYNVNAFCKEVASGGGTHSAMIDKDCFGMEQKAYNTIKPAWAAIPDRTRKFCDEVASVGGQGSYTILQSCIDIEIKASSAKSSRSSKF